MRVHYRCLLNVWLYIDLKPITPTPCSILMKYQTFAEFIHRNTKAEEDIHPRAQPEDCMSSEALVFLCTHEINV